MDRDQIEAVNCRESLLLRARAVARRIRERVWRVMDRHGLPPPHSPAVPSQQEPRETAARNRDGFRV